MPDAEEERRRLHGTGREVYGSTPSVFGKVYGSLHVESREQARLLQAVLEDGLRKHAGKHQETYLAKLYNELERMADRASKENWTGWNGGGGGA